MDVVLQTVDMVCVSTMDLGGAMIYSLGQVRQQVHTNLENIKPSLIHGHGNTTNSITTLELHATF